MGERRGGTGILRAGRPGNEGFRGGAQNHVGMYRINLSTVLSICGLSRINLGFRQIEVPCNTPLVRRHITRADAAESSIPSG